MEDVLTPWQQVSVVRDVVGTCPRLMPYDEVVKVVISDTRCGVTVRRFDARDYATETRLFNPRKVTQAWTLVDGVWKPVVMEIDGRLTTEFVTEEAPDPKCPYKIISHRGGKTVDEYRDSLYWDALCARPGAGRLNQRDHAGVQADTAKRWSRVFGASRLAGRASRLD